MRTKLILAGAGLALFTALAGAWLVFNGPGQGSAADNPGAAVPAGESDRLSAALVPGAKAALSDNKVTRDEYVAAVDATVACMRAAGIRVSDPVWSGGSLAYTSEFPSQEGLSAGKAVTESCYEDYLRGIDIVWSATAPK